MSTTTKKKNPTTKAGSKRNNTSTTSVENGIKIIQHAIRKKVSVSTASKMLKRGRNYISDIRARLEENYKSKNISRDQYSSFKSLYKNYQKEVSGR